MATNFFGGSFFGGGFFGAGVTPVVVDTTHVGGGGIQPKRRTLHAYKPTGLGGYRRKKPTTQPEAEVEARLEQAQLDLAGISEGIRAELDAKRL